ncbi:asparagine synthase-related protein [Streptomyces sp. HMX112]|uniref:asparagine synthase-related protein n=1 Tax=Streptomyces sp. HMX112 TaxID=3390850 RepID=UPI003A7FD4EB
MGCDGFGLRSAPAEGGEAEFVTFGSCLATYQERREARDSAERGRWAHAARLPGSYLTLVRSGSTVRVIGDRAGVHVVYWVYDGDEVVWSTSALVLASYTGGQPSVARLLAGMSLYGVDPLGEASYFEGVRRVPPGRALVLTPGRPPRTETVPRACGTVSLAEGAQAVAHHLATAVHRRANLGCAVSCDLSGGVDSSIVTSLAAARSALLAITYTDSQLAGQDDVRYAQRVAAQYDTIRHVRVDGTSQHVEHFGMLQERDSLPLTDSPSLSLGLLAIKGAHLAPAVAYGSGLHLTGRGGDNVLDSIPLIQVDRARGGQRRQAAAGIAAFARQRRISLHSAVFQAARTAVTPQARALDTLATALIEPAPLSASAYLRPTELLAWCGPLSSADWLSGAGRRAVAQVVTARAGATLAGALPGAEHERMALERMGEEHATYDQIARQRWGLPMHAPYLDAPVVDACLAVPGWERWAPGDFKPLARAAFTGTVPHFLLQWRTKTPMTSSLHRGLRTNVGTLRSILAGSRLAQAGLIDPAPALAALEGAARGELAPLGALHQLIATELWLVTLPTTRDRWWEPASSGQEAA